MRIIRALITATSYSGQHVLTNPCQIATDTPSLACEVEAHIRRREFRSADVRVRGNEVLIDKDGNSWSPTSIPFHEPHFYNSVQQSWSLLGFLPAHEAHTRGS